MQHIRIGGCKGTHGAVSRCVLGQRRALLHLSRPFSPDCRVESPVARRRGWTRLSKRLRRREGGLVRRCGATPHIQDGRALRVSAVLFAFAVLEFVADFGDPRVEDNAGCHLEEVKG